MTTIAFRAVTDTGNMHIMDINTTAPHLRNKSQILGGWLISEVTGSVLDYPVPHKKCQLIFITSHQSFEYHGINYTNTLKSITGNYWPHKTTLYDKSSHLLWMAFTIFYKMLYQSWVHLDLRPSTQQHAIWQTTTWWGLIYNEYKFTVHQTVMYIIKPEGRKEMFYLMMHSTHFIQLDGWGHVVKNHSDC